LLLASQNTIKLIKRLNGEIVLVFKVEDLDHSLSGGGVALVCEEGRIGTDDVYVRSEFAP